MSSVGVKRSEEFEDAKGNSVLVSNSTTHVHVLEKKISLR